MAVVIAAISTALVIALTPAGNLYAADLAMERGYWGEAIKYFNQALDSKQLNDPAKIIVYWNLHMAYENMSDINNSAEALLSYIVYSTDFLNSLAGPPLSMNLELLDWAKREKVSKRLDAAKEKIDRYWSTRRSQIKKL